MDAPDELVEVVSVEMLGGTEQWAYLAPDVQSMYLARTRKFMAVPAIADALRDAALFAEVREAWRACDGGQSDLEVALSQIMPPLYPETGKGEA